MTCLPNSSFVDFVREHLLRSGVIDGVLVTTQHGEVVYSFGELKSPVQEDVDLFVGLFSTRSAQRPELPNQPDIQVGLQSYGRMIYKVYQRTFTSVYATSCVNAGGLVACQLPYGVVVCVYKSPSKAGEAVKRVEQFCDMLKR